MGNKSLKLKHHTVEPTIKPRLSLTPTLRRCRLPPPHPRFCSRVPAQLRQAQGGCGLPYSRITFLEVWFSAGRGLHRYYIAYGNNFYNNIIMIIIYNHRYYIA